MGYWEPKTVKMHRILLLLISSFMVPGCSEKLKKPEQLPFYNEADFTPLFLKGKEIKERVKHTINDFAFLNQDSLLITQQTIAGKIHVANFIFTTCGSICPVMTSHLKIVNERFKNDTSVVFLSYSVTPWIDKPFILRQYKLANRITNPNWHFLTGSKSSIYALARQSYFAEEDLGFTKDSSEFLHTEHFILVDKHKHIRGIYNGTLQLEMQQLSEDISLLKQEE